MKSYIDLSILIPTYKRLVLLNECLLSITKQEVTPNEILIGNDDSSMLLSQEQLKKKFNLPILVFNRKIPLGQSRNVQDLISNSNSTWLMILHDDDLLLENSLKNFFSYVSHDKSMVYFGMQKLLTNKGLQTDKEGVIFNNQFKRNSTLNDMSTFDIVLNQSVPSNGFIINTNTAKSIEYTYNIKFSNYGLIKDACDYAFTWKCFKHNLNFNFVPLFTTAYRITEGSVSNSKNVTILESFLVELDIFLNFNLIKSLKIFIKKKLNKRYTKALKTCIRIKNWKLLYQLILLKLKS
ncbi:glycosyltransferase [Ferrovum sp. PN-J185]|uniref:glycosyltransferase family 2 protein n=1 Tax=Ferrovum sp. PN-J185 TaxID=1356306 RepID=UPI00079756F3|nr:glycosyltransferase [Ferrovum sp. PN-J185]KXW55936.1 abequosyltransferase RfbV [Ferrovum sp. PN-J185]MCC6068676.1 glycosyltransferase [Ferrovum sp. PN-J185]MDE1891921.1 glycosyltransferase [Betaproteobacteria bacterium]MDE2056998.1 glycosyltransferase [Betaproteobacteria bacterium]